MDKLTNLFPFLVTYFDQALSNDFTLLAFAETVDEATTLANTFLRGQHYLITGVALLQVQCTLVPEVEEWQNTTTDELSDPLRRQ